MTARSIRLLPVLFALATVARGASYPVRHMQPNDALMALSARVPGMRQDCGTDARPAADPRSAGMIGMLFINCASDAIQSQVQAALAAIDVPPPTRTFHVVVLGASRKDGAQPELPPSELKALNDFKKVMTYKSFPLEAETVLQCDGDAQTQLGGYMLELSINPNTSADDAIDVRKFQLHT